MIITNRQLAHNDPAYLLQGIKGYNVVSLGAPDLEIPGNIFVCKEPDPAQACLDMYWMLHTSPVNFATWNPDYAAVSKELRIRVAIKMRENPDFFNFANFEFAHDNKAPQQAPEKSQSIAEQFKKHAEQAILRPKDKKLIGIWGYTTTNIFKQFTTHMPKADFKLEFENSTHDTAQSRTKGHPDLNMHIVLICDKSSIVSLRPKPSNCLAYRHWSFNGYSGERFFVTVDMHI